MLLAAVACLCLSARFLLLVLHTFIAVARLLLDWCAYGFWIGRFASAFLIGLLALLLGFDAFLPLRFLALGSLFVPFVFGPFSFFPFLFLIRFYHNLRCLKLGQHPKNTMFSTRFMLIEYEPNSALICSSSSSNP